jgi:hypothetical protein
MVLQDFTTTHVVESKEELTVYPNHCWESTTKPAAGSIQLGSPLRNTHVDHIDMDGHISNPKKLI